MLSLEMLFPSPRISILLLFRRGTLSIPAHRGQTDGFCCDERILSLTF